MGSEGHDIHRLHEFVPHLAQRQPELLALLPLEDRPAQGESLLDWALALTPVRLMEICNAWVLETLSILKETSPLSNVLLRGTLLLTGEFDLSDAAAVATGTVPRHGDPRRDEIREALKRATRAGVLIYLADSERYCVPFPVRLAFEGVNFLDPLERESISLRAIDRFSRVAGELVEDGEQLSPGHWRFSNMLTALEFAVDAMEGHLGVDADEWLSSGHDFASVPESLVEPLMLLVECMGAALTQRQSNSVVRLLAAGAAAARSAGAHGREANLLMLMGQYFLAREQFSAALFAYERCEKLRLACRDMKGVVVAISGMALTHRKASEPELAVQQFLRACDVAHDHELHSQEVDIANCAATIMLGLGRYDAVIALAEKVMVSLQRGQRKHPAVAELFVHQGTAFRLQSRHREARDRIFHALALAKGFDSRAGEAMASLELAELFESLGEREEVVKWIRRAKNLYIQLGDYVGLTHCYLAFARAGGDTQGERDLDACLSKALQCAQASRDEMLVARVWHERGLLSLRQGFYTVAINHFTQEVSSLKRTVKVEALVNSHMQLAELYLKQESHLAAATEALRAQAVARAFARTGEPDALPLLLARTRSHLTPEQFEFLIQEVSDELEAGSLKEA
ncbi:hypothetical protein IT570_01260 [Candidatus Sumerlaeota bacterium]|nr:hypothetical protein [Candidatus Sumerlaeota bacterium]